MGKTGYLTGGKDDRVLISNPGGENGKGKIEKLAVTFKAKAKAECMW